MSIYAVVLNEANTEASDRLIAAYPGHYKLSDTFFLVRGSFLTDDIAKTVGIKGDDRIEKAWGVVFHLPLTYSGFNDRALWEWLQKAEEAEK